MPPTPKRTAEHQAAGTCRADRQQLLPLTPGNPPPPPKWLSKSAKRKWREVAERLAGAGVLTALDADALAAYVTAFITWRNSAELVAAEGETYGAANGLKKAHPAVGIMQAAAKEMLAWAGLLALTPAARQRLRVETPPPATPGKDKSRFFAACKVE
jgi:P27 family predicted phage terminase small subunit